MKVNIPGCWKRILVNFECPIEVVKAQPERLIMGSNCLRYDGVTYHLYDGYTTALVVRVSPADPFKRMTLVRQGSRPLQLNKVLRYNDKARLIQGRIVLCRRYNTDNIQMFLLPENDHGTSSSAQDYPPR
jgi:hypothetical protein